MILTCANHLHQELYRETLATRPGYQTFSHSGSYCQSCQTQGRRKNIIGLGAGEPDFDTPLHIKDAAITAIRNGFTKYTAVGGTASLKQAIISKFKRENSLEFMPGEILVSSGGKQSFFNLVLATIDPGDEVIIPAPYWVSYPDIVLIAEGKPVLSIPASKRNSKSHRISWKKRSPQNPHVRRQQPEQPFRQCVQFRRTAGPGCSVA